MIVGLLISVWSEVDPITLAERVLLSGLMGLCCGYLIGRLYTRVFNDWLEKKEEHPSAETATRTKMPGEGSKLQPWNPPRLSGEEQGRE